MSTSLLLSEAVCRNKCFIVVPKLATRLYSFHFFEKKLAKEFRRAGMTKITLQKPNFVNINEV